VLGGGGVAPRGGLPWGRGRGGAGEGGGTLGVGGGAGGYVFAVVHNLQANVPLRNMRALFDAFRRNRTGRQENETG